MKTILKLYEGILDNDVTIVKNIHRASITLTQVNDWLKDHIPAVYDRYLRNENSNKFSIDDDGFITVNFKYTGSREDVVISDNLPEFINFKKFEYYNQPVYVEGEAITSLRGLPDDLEELVICDCPNLTTFEDAPKTCNYLKVINCPNLKSLRGLPKCKNIRFKNCPGWDVKKIAKFTTTKKSNIIVI